MKTKYIAQLLLTLLCFAACKKDDTGAPPTIDHVRIIAKDSATTTGMRSNVYAIIGNNLATTTKVTFNGYDAFINSALIRDDNIIITIPSNTPWKGVSNELVVTTKYGSVTMPFTIQQPGPKITSFDPLAAAAGDIVTITGDIFDNVTRVTFDSTEAEIVSATSTEIKVKVPAGIVQAYVYVFTPGGTAKSPAAFGFKFVAYDDALAPGWWEGSWSSAVDLKNTVIVKRGTYAIQEQYTGGYGGFQIGNGGATIDLDGFSAVKISIFGGPGTDGKLVKLVLNGDYDHGVTLTLKENAWSDFTVPLSQLNSPATLQSIVVQEFSGNAPSIIYLDDIGLI